MPYWKQNSRYVRELSQWYSWESLGWNGEAITTDRWKRSRLTLQLISFFFFFLRYSRPDPKAFNNCTVMSLVLMLKNLSEAVILFVLYNLLISPLWFPWRTSCCGFVLVMLSHIHTFSLEQFTITVIVGPSESPGRSLSFSFLSFILIFW